MCHQHLEHVGIALSSLRKICIPLPKHLKCIIKKMEGIIGNSHLKFRILVLACEGTTPLLAYNQKHFTCFVSLRQICMAPVLRKNLLPFGLKVIECIAVKECQCECQNSNQMLQTFSYFLQYSLLVLGAGVIMLIIALKLKNITLFQI